MTAQELVSMRKKMQMTQTQVAKVMAFPCKNTKSLKMVKAISEKSIGSPGNAYHHIGGRASRCFDRRSTQTG